MICIYSGVPEYPVSFLVSYLEPCYCYFQNFGIAKMSTGGGFKAFPQQEWVSLLVYLRTNLGIAWIPDPGHRLWEQLSTSNAGIHTAQLWGHGSWLLCFTDAWLRSRWLRTVICLMILLKWAKHQWWAAFIIAAFWGNRAELGDPRATLH